MSQPQQPGPPQQPYAPPAGEAMQMQVQPKGSILLGFLAGFFGGCIGLILVLILAKTPETKRGAGIGFAVQMVIGAVLRLAAS